MKGNEKLIAALNNLLADELTAINQYIVHAEMCDNWGYGQLSGAIEKRSIQEMKHAEKLIARILFLEGTPVVSKLNAINIGKDVPKQFESDHAAEAGAIRNYNEAIQLADEVKDSATKQLLESILKDEDAHIDEIEENQDQISQMGIGIYLSTKAGE
jgi:bacterioferritin